MRHNEYPVPGDSDLLFVYGTLLKQSNSAIAGFLKANSRFVAEGFFPGKLYDLGTYPGAVFIPGSRSKVFGTVLKLADPAKTFEKLDKYEETGDGFPHPNEYLRKIIPIGTTSKKTLNCWAYLYNYPTENKPLIVSGKYFGEQCGTGF
ncbi:MAG: gamma-glutamylcyclotransferase family protein [Prolixibacteraceae bacterium]|nr:gamma-glutamylcyclotransferase family protein [Prolixibacteraceae bacterium]